jgi:hypothetical protein
MPGFGSGPVAFYQGFILIRNVFQYGGPRKDSNLLQSSQGPLYTNPTALLGGRLLTVLAHIETHSTISFLGTRPERPGLEMLGDILFRSRDGKNTAV